jgi:hypothetical protein
MSKGSDPIIITLSPFYGKTGKAYLSTEDLEVF